jgi:hypothetical protein
MKLRLLIFGFLLINIHFLFAQNLVIPPKINIEHREAAFGPVLFDVRIWGWSNNGKVAYSTLYEWSEIIPSINFVILDLVSDRVLFKLRMSTYDENFELRLRDEDIFNMNRTVILNALQTHNIILHNRIEQKTEFLQFPIRRNNLIYECQVINTEYGKNNNGENGVLGYSVMVTVNNKRKIIGNFIPPFVDEINIKGYFLSPFENRIAVVVAEWGWYQYGAREYRFTGCHLDVGFE